MLHKHVQQSEQSKQLKFCTRNKRIKCLWIPELLAKQSCWKQTLACAMICGSMLFFAVWLFFIHLVYNSFNFLYYSKPSVSLDCIKEYSLTVFISRTFYTCGRVNKEKSFPCLSCREPKLKWIYRLRCSWSWYLSFIFYFDFLLSFLITFLNFFPALIIVDRYRRGYNSTWWLHRRRITDWYVVETSTSWRLCRGCQ